VTDSSVSIPVDRITPTDTAPAARTLPVEMPIAVEYNGIGYAVMMATPVDLEDFAVGFSLSERIVRHAADVLEVNAHETPQGIVLRITVAQDRMEPMLERVRVRVSESSCGLCGLENLEQVARPLPPIEVRMDVAPSAIFAALEGLYDHQPLNKATGGAHAAAFCTPDGAILVAREDVGRHCALDKLIGALARQGTSPSSGFFLLSSRCSYELVEKTVIAGCPTLVTISTATSLAAERAKAAGLTLIALARRDAMLRLG
jgi:FdhD protein